MMSMKRLLSVLILFLPLSLTAGQDWNPQASDEAVVIVGNARFTVLTDRLVRMEWSEDGVFEDRASLAIVNRRLPVPSFKTVRSDGMLTLKTDALVLTYKGQGRFDKANLSVSFRMNGKTQVWYPGKDASGNLLGTSRTLDKCNGFGQLNPGDPMEPGVISRDGWAIVDESFRHLFQKNDSDWGEWVVARPEAI